jgi:hypothetical protein
MDCGYVEEGCGGEDELRVSEDRIVPAEESGGG